MCSNTRQAIAASKDPAANGRAAAPDAGGAELGDVPEHQAGARPIEGPGGDRGGGRPRPEVARSPAAPLRLEDLRPGRVDADDPAGAPAVRQPGDLPLAGADVED